MGTVFEPDALHAIAKRAVGLPFEEMVDTVIAGCAEAWPRWVEAKQDWLFNLAGGATGVMTVLHASLSEYLILFGTPIGTNAFSGRYRLDIWDCVLSGTMKTYTDRSFAHAVVTEPGGMALLRRGEVKGFSLSEDCWLLEYGRGPIPTALGVALFGDATFSAQDPPIIGKTLWIYGRQVARNLWRRKI
jgi:C-8 sterol isomerase